MRGGPLFIRKEASSGRRAARGWTACCVLGGVLLGDAASVLPGVLRGHRGTCWGAGPPEPPGAAGLREEAPTRGWGVQLCICRDGGFVCLRTSLPDGSMSGSDPRRGHWVTWIQDSGGGGFSLSGNSSGCETWPGAPV